MITRNRVCVVMFFFVLCMFYLYLFYIPVSLFTMLLAVLPNLHKSYMYVCMYVRSNSSIVFFSSGLKDDKVLRFKIVTDCRSYCWINTQTDMVKNYFVNAITQCITTKINSLHFAKKSKINVTMQPDALQQKPYQLMVCVEDDYTVSQNNALPSCDHNLVRS